MSRNKNRKQVSADDDDQVYYRKSAVQDNQMGILLLIADQ